MAGRLEVITGPMFAGKTEELLRRIERARIARKTTLVFKPSIDIRYAETEIVAHNGRKCPAKVLSPDITLNEFFSRYHKEIKEAEIVAVDEAQFFNRGNFPEIVKMLVYIRKRVIVAGLDLNFKGETFGPMGELLALADEVLKLTAICEICGEPATKTQRLLDGKPVTSGPEIQIGAKESYIPVCNRHFNRPIEMSPLF